MKRCAYLCLLLGSALSLMMAARGIVLAQAQPQLTSAYRADVLPADDPLSAAWAEAPTLNVPLIPQAGVAPALLQATIPSVNVQSLNDGRTIAFRVTWDDATPNWHATHTDEFRDALAIQFPTAPDAATICMGAAGQLVNLWHWKADWQYDIDNGFHDLPDAYPNFYLDHYPFVSGEPPYRVPGDFDEEAKAYMAGWAAGNRFSNPSRPSPVEDLNAMGFGSTHSQERQDVAGKGIWRDGRWSVVFARPLATEDANDVQFAAGQTTSVAFAVWDGAERQVGAIKQLSSWVPLRIQAAAAQAQPTAVVAQPSPAPADNTTLFIILALVALALVIAAFAWIYFRLPES
jgi:hypothetical protein